MTGLGVLMHKALTDADYDLLDEADSGGTRAHVSGGGRRAKSGCAQSPSVSG